MLQLQEDIKRLIDLRAALERTTTDGGTATGGRDALEESLRTIKLPDRIDYLYSPY
jgi:hypothetical protein